MKRHTKRKEFLKIRIKGLSYKQCQIELKEKFDIEASIPTLKRWWKKFDTTDWDLQDKSQRPKKLQVKFTKKEKDAVIELRKVYGYGPKKIRILAQERGIFMSPSTVKRMIRSSGLSRGSKMEGTKLKWVRFERPDPNYMWQMDGDQNDDGTWRVPVIDDCSRYCLVVPEIKQNTTKAMIEIL